MGYSPRVIKSQTQLSDFTFTFTLPNMLLLLQIGAKTQHFLSVRPRSPPLVHIMLLSLQSCPTLCDPIDGSPPGSPISGILQARTLEWVATSFSNA